LQTCLRVVALAELEATAHPHILWWDPLIGIIVQSPVLIHQRYLIEAEMFAKLHPHALHLLADQRLILGPAELKRELIKQ